MQPTTVDLIVELFFRDKWPNETDRILDLGCGPGAFIDGILRWSKNNNVKTPQITTGVELDAERAEKEKRSRPYHKLRSKPAISCLMKSRGLLTMSLEILLAYQYWPSRTQKSGISVTATSVP
jgi:hypothetical protein